MGTKEYRIGEFAKAVSVSTYTLRFYEKEGLLSSKKINGQRVYTDDDKDWFDFLMHLKGAGLSLYEMKQYVNLRNQGSQTIDQRRELLTTKQSELEKQIHDLNKHLKVLQDKISFYDGIKDGTIQTDFKTFQKNNTERK